MSKRISNLGGINITPAYDIPGYTYDPVNDWFIDDATGKIFGPKINPPEIRLQSKTVTQNGVVTADEGYDGLDQVTVNVPTPTLYCYKNSYSTPLYTSIRNLILGVDISSSIVVGNEDYSITHPENTPYSVVKVRYDEDQGTYVLDPDGDTIAIQDGSSNFYIRDTQGDITLNS